MITALLIIFFWIYLKMELVAWYLLWMHGMRPRITCSNIMNICFSKVLIMLQALSIFNNLIWHRPWSNLKRMTTTRKPSSKLSYISYILLYAACFWSCISFCGFTLNSHDSARQTRLYVPKVWKLLSNFLGHICGRVSFQKNIKENKQQKICQQNTTNYLLLNIKLWLCL